MAATPSPYTAAAARIARDSRGSTIAFVAAVARSFTRWPTKFPYASATPSEICAAWRGWSAVALIVMTSLSELASSLMSGRRSSGVSGDRFSLLMTSWSTVAESMIAIWSLA
jgi:hypothetical protein